MIKRYSTDDMSKIWSDQNKFNTWKIVELAVVDVMTDKGLISYKGKPFLNYKQRKEIISQIKAVDYVIPLNGLLYLEIAEKLKIDYFIHGTDWKKGSQRNVRDQLLKKVKIWGGRVIEIPYTKNISSTKIKKLIYNQYKK